MSLQMNRATWLLILALTGCLQAGQGFAQQPSHPIRNSLERAGRLYGVCWGDGYHACSSSGLRPWADLPPKSMLTSTVSHRSSVGKKHQQGATFYDRFDAINQSLFHTSSCCLPGCEVLGCDGRGCSSSACGKSGCDGIACDSNGCDGTALNPGLEQGVSMTHANSGMPMQVTEPSANVELPTFSGTPQPEFLFPTQDQASENQLPSQLFGEANQGPGEADQGPTDNTFDPQPILSTHRLLNSDKLRPPRVRSPPIRRPLGHRSAIHLTICLSQSLVFPKPRPRSRRPTHPRRRL